MEVEAYRVLPVLWTKGSEMTDATTAFWLGLLVMLAGVMVPGWLGTGISIAGAGAALGAILAGALW